MIIVICICTLRVSAIELLSVNPTSVLVLISAVTVLRRGDYMHPSRVFVALFMMCCSSSFSHTYEIVGSIAK